MVDGRNGGGEASSFKAVNHSNSEPAPTDDHAQSGGTRQSVAPEDAPSSKGPSKASSTRNSTPAAAPSDQRQAAQTTTTTPAAAEQPPQSQSMAASTSTSSPASAKDAKEVSAAPYGTRSRNRPGASRINYAEDVEMDFEMTQPSANGNISDGPSRGSAVAEGRQSPSGGGKKGAGAGQGAAPWGNTGPNSNPKDTAQNPAAIPGMLSFAANPQAAQTQPPKRRKNAANHATNGNHAHSAAPSHAGSKRANAMVAANNSRESNMMTFEKNGPFLKNGKLEADDGQTIAVNDQVYLVCEPPGEPYYLCRIMEFIHTNGDPKERVESMRVNWFYRPRDVQRYNNDTRLVYATMHSDICPIASLRGRCTILHRSEILGDIDEYRKTKDSFWFNQVFDRFIHRWYDVIPTSSVINVPEKVKKALDERWKYICVETSRVKELTSAVKTCKRCVGYCASNDSVECAVCRMTYHMNCVRPPLLKKPSRGFAWACGPCSRAQEKKLEARRTPLIGAGNDEADDEEVLDEEEEEPGGATTAPSPEGSDSQAVDLHPATQAEIALAKMWPMRYLGIHCRVEDALQYDDRAIYPRASSRLGPRHQANVNVWHGHPVEFVKPAEIKRRYVKSSSHKKDAKLSKETVAALEADKAEKAKRPKWVQDEPPGYIHRGEDYTNKDSKCTAELMFKMPPLGVHSSRGEDDAPTVTEQQVEAYMSRAKALAQHVGVKEYSTNFLDKCLALFTKHNYDADTALKHVKKLDKRKDLREPELANKEEEKKWNEGVAKYGSEIRSVRLHTSKTMFYGDAVRYYYMWKKTPKGQEIWGSYSNRKGKNRKAEADASTRLLDDIADVQDDSAFDNEKAEQRKRGFQCKFCSTRASRQWRRAPGVVAGQTVSADGKSVGKDKSGAFVVALCQRCANLWRKYAVKWENTDEIAKKVAQGGGKAWKRRIDEELLREVYAANEAASTNGAPEYSDMPLAPGPATVEPPKKKQKTSAAEKDSGVMTPTNESVAKKKEKEKPAPPSRLPTPPPVPAPPKLRVLPCAVCRSADFALNTKLECTACRMTVHKSCYGIDEVRSGKAWFCDTCKNDKKESVSYNYECVLCPVKVTEQDLYEPPKVSHKKKTDRDREKERLEKELVDKAREEYRISQSEKGRPMFPREPLKRTADNNWVHVHCAIWIPETKFGNAHRLDMIEGIGAPTLRYEPICKICKSSDGACVSCQQCHANFHVGCAHAHGYTFGFDMTPVKATRRDTIPVYTVNGETGAMTAAIWCKEHALKTIVHPMTEEVKEYNMSALRLFSREYKQADLTLTGTARKANLVDQSTRTVPQSSAPSQGNRRASTTAGPTPTSARGRPSNASIAMKEEHNNEVAALKPERRCAKCNIDVSPRWWKLDESAPAVRAAEEKAAVNGVEHNGATPLDHASRSDIPSMNGSVDHRMTDAPVVLTHETPSRLRVDTDVSRPVAYLCQKCHWKKLNAPEESPERERSHSTLPEPQQAQHRSPPPPFAQPPGPWMTPEARGPAPAEAPPPRIGEYPYPPHMPVPPPYAVGLPHPPNGIGYPPTAVRPPPHMPPYPPPNGVYQQPNGIPPIPGPGGPPQIPPGPHRGPFPPTVSVSGPPPPLHLNNSAMVPNGMHSPRMAYSPTHPSGHMSSRSSESPFPPGPPPLAHYPPVHHGSPAPPTINNRPSTPRDTTMRDAPAPNAPLENRVATGASQSPSLRNLLH